MYVASKLARSTCFPLEILSEIVVVNMKQLVNRETWFPSKTKILLNSCVHLQSCLTQLFSSLFILILHLYCITLFMCFVSCCDQSCLSVICQLQSCLLHTILLCLSISRPMSISSPFLLVTRRTRTPKNLQNWRRLQSWRYCSKLRFSLFLLTRIFGRQWVRLVLPVVPSRQTSNQSSVTPIQLTLCVILILCYLTTFLIMKQKAGWIRSSSS